MNGKRRSGPGVADNRGVKVLVDKGALLCGCVLLALLAGRADALVVIWLLAAATVGGLSVVADQRRWIIVAPVVYLLLGALTTASVAGAPLAVYDLARLAALGTRRQRAVAAVGCATAVVLDRANRRASRHGRTADARDETRREGASVS